MHEKLLSIASSIVPTVKSQRFSTNHSILYRGFTESVFAERRLSNVRFSLNFDTVIWWSLLTNCEIPVLIHTVSFEKCQSEAKVSFGSENGPKTPNKVERVYNMAKISEINIWIHYRSRCI